MRSSPASPMMTSGPSVPVRVSFWGVPRIVAGNPKHVGGVCAATGRAAIVPKAMDKRRVTATRLDTANLPEGFPRDSLPALRTAKPVHLNQMERRGESASLDYAAVGSPSLAGRQCSVVLALATGRTVPATLADAPAFRIFNLLQQGMSLS